jgi:small subunit ribosomal protein S6
MSIYDTTFILNPQLEESGLDSRIQEYINLIGNNGGKMVKENRIGMRRLAYEIENLNQGYYISLVFDGPSELVTELERRLRLDDGCIRFLTCLYEDFGARRRDKKKKKEKPLSDQKWSSETGESGENEKPQREPEKKQESESMDSGEELL